MGQVENKSLGEATSERIITYITQNKLEVGEKLPNEFELGELLGVGRSTIREAIKILTSKNILEIKRGAGTFVSQKQGIPDDPLGLALLSDKKQLAKDLLEVRFMIEPEIASLAAVNATDEQIEEILRWCDVVEESIRKGENHMDKDIQFHTSIARASGNSVVSNLVPIIHSAITIFVDVTNSALRQETIETHREVAEAIMNRNPHAARDAMVLHLTYNRRKIAKLKTLEEQ